MPTAVELKFADLLETFLKLDGIDGRGEQSLLTDAFHKVDTAFLKLNGATSEDFLKLEHKYDPVTDAIGEAFVKLSGNFGGIAELGLDLDRLFSANGGPTKASVDTISPSADFLKLDAALTADASDLKSFGSDFLKLDSAPTVADFLKMETALGDGSVRLATDMGDSAKFFTQLGEDFLKIAPTSVDTATPLQMEFLKLGQALEAVGNQFGPLATDFTQLSSDFYAYGGGGAGTNANGALLPAVQLGADLMTVNQDFLKLDGALHNVATPAAETVLTLLGVGGGGAGKTG
jgi:hypothetical protein